jgi:hypothetical protein
MEIEIIDYCNSPFSVKVNGKELEDIENAKEILIKFVTEIIENGDEHVLAQLLSTLVFDHPRLNESLSESTMEKCDQCGDYNRYEKYIIENNI